MLGMFWRHMSTAPQNQTVLLALDGGQVTIGSKCGDFWMWEPCDDEAEDAAALYWMPLPAPPTQPTGRKD